MRLAPLTGLFGANSSGKSSVIQMLLLMKQTAESVDRLQPLNFGDVNSRVELGSLRDVLYEHDMERSLMLGYRWRSRDPLVVRDPVSPGRTLIQSQSVDFETSISAGSRLRPVVDYFEYRLGDSKVRMEAATKRQRRSPSEYRLTATMGQNSDYLTRSPGRPWNLPAPVKCYGFPDEVAAYYQNAGFTADLELELDRAFTNSIYYLGPLRERPSRQYRWQGSQPQDVGVAGERAIEALLASQDKGRPNTRGYNSRGRAFRRISVEQHVAEWLKQLNLIDEFTVSRLSEDADIYRVQVKPHWGDSFVGLTDVGIGVSQILPVLVLLAWVPEGATVLLEQPELHLHPAVQGGLADILVEVANVRRVQVIVESHSEHLLRRLQLRSAEGELAPEDVALYFCHRTRSGSRAASLRLNRYGEIQNWPADFFGDTLGETAAIARAALLTRKREAG